jgi:hypothetical protein
MNALRWMLPAVLLVGALPIFDAEAAPRSEPWSQDGVKSRLEALEKRFQDERNAVIAEYRSAKTDEEKEKAIAKLPGAGYIPEFRALAEEAKGTETGAQAWLWVLRLIEDDPTASWEVVETLLGDYIAFEALADVPGHLRYATSDYGETKVVEALRALDAESPHAKVRASALFTLGGVLIEAGKKAEGRTCLESVIAKYGDLETFRESSYRKAAEGFLFELDHLQIGMAAPDFESVDENGVKWKLSDYRGKVTIVDFWGFW